MKANKSNSKGNLFSPARTDYQSLQATVKKGRHSSGTLSPENTLALKKQLNSAVNPKKRNECLGSELWAQTTQEQSNQFNSTEHFGDSESNQCMVSHRALSTNRVSKTQQKKVTSTIIDTSEKYTRAKYNPSRLFAQASTQKNSEISDQIISQKRRSGSIEFTKESTNYRSKSQHQRKGITSEKSAIIDRKIRGLSDLDLSLRYGYNNKKDVLWESMNVRNKCMTTKPFQTGSRNTSILMNQIVKHIEIDLQIKPKNKGSYYTEKAIGKGYRQPLGYELRQSSQIPSFTQLRTLDAPDVKIADIFPGSKGLKSLKQEIMKSSSEVFKIPSNEFSRQPTRESVQDARTSLVVVKNELFKQFSGHLAKPEKLGKPKISNHVNASRSKMFHTSKIY